MFAILMVGSPIVFVFGIMTMMGGYMSDAPMEGNRAAGQGFSLVLFAIVVFIFAFVARHYGWIH